MGNHSNQFFKDDHSDWEHMWEGIHRKIIGYDDRLMLVRVKFSKGTEAPSHQHPHSQASLIAAGKFQVHIGKRTMLLSTGDGFYVPPDVVHSVTAVEDGEIVDSFSPIREDFLT